MSVATADEIAELLGDRAEDSIVERIANVGASVAEVSEALDDVDYQARFGEERDAATPKIDEVRKILEELPYLEDVVPEAAEDEEHEGLRVIGADELASELP